MKKTLILIALVFLLAGAKAQSTYNRAIGFKFPGGFAVTYKQFLNDYNNVEAEAMFWNHGFRAVALYEFNFDIEGIEGLRWFVGPGAHVGFWNNAYKKSENVNSAGFGIDGIIGLDYKVADLPVNVSVDWQPGLDIIGSSGVTAAYGGIGVRYTF